MRDEGVSRGLSAPALWAARVMRVEAPATSTSGQGRPGRLDSFILRRPRPIGPATLATVLCSLPSSNQRLGAGEA